MTKTRRTRRPRGHIVERKGARETTFRLKFDLPNTAGDGKRRTIYQTFRGTRKDAERELRRLLDQAEKGVHVDAAGQSLTNWIETWLQDHVRHDVATRTHERYCDLLRQYVEPRIGKLTLRELSPLHIETFYHALGETGGRPRGPKPKTEGAVSPKGLAPRTVLLTHRVLFSCLKDAARLRLIDHNPVAEVKRPRVTKTAATAGDGGRPPVVKMRVLDRDDLSRLLDSFRARKLESASYPLVLLALDSGARRGELLGLRWVDVNLDGRTLQIARSVEVTRARGVTIKRELKTESSRRTITVSTCTASVLRGLWKDQTETLLKLGRRLPPDALIFPASILEPTVPRRPSSVTRGFARVVKDLNFTGLRFHDLRHNCASHMLEAGRSIPDVAHHLGHSTPAVTLSVYAHKIPRKEAGSGLLDMMLPALTPG